MEILNEMKTKLQAELLEERMNMGEEKIRLRKICLDEKNRVNNMRADIASCKKFIKESYGAYMALCNLMLIVQKKSGKEVGWLLI